MGLAIDRDGNVFIGDMSNFGLHKYSGTGVFLWFGGGYGYEQGRFWQFGGFALNDQGDIYVADLLLGRIQKFDKDKNYYGTQWVSWGPQPGWLDGPSDVALDASGNVYVADMENWRIQKFDANGRLLLSNIGLGNIHPVAVAVGPLTGSNSDKWDRWTLNGFTLGSGTIWASHYVEDASGNVVGNLKLYKANGQYIDDWFVDNLFSGGIAL